MTEYISAEETSKGPNDRTPADVEEFFKGTVTPFLLLAIRKLCDMVDEANKHEPFSLILGNWFIGSSKQMRVRTEDEEGNLSNPAILHTGQPTLTGGKK